MHDTMMVAIYEWEVHPPQCHAFIARGDYDAALGEKNQEDGLIGKRWIV
jgi:hypothetical protein